VLNISLLSEGSNLMLYANTNPVLTTAIKSNTSAPFIILNNRSFDDYLNGFGNKKRYDLKKKQKVLCEGHGVEYTSCDPSQLTEGIKALFYLHELRAKSKKNNKHL
jgi:predicted N-acyltransferase